MLWQYLRDEKESPEFIRKDKKNASYYYSIGNPNIMFWFSSNVFSRARKHLTLGIKANDSLCSFCTCNDCGGVN
jgi:hypothetical protein